MNASKRQATSAHGIHQKETLESSVESAERALVLKEYKEALHISLKVLSAAKQDAPPSKQNNDCVVLTTALDDGMQRQENSTIDSLVVQMTGDVSLYDRAAVVALQASHEMSDSNSVGRRAFVEYYSQHTMPLCVAILWIQFLACSKPTLAVELAAQVLHHARQYPSVSEAAEELAMFLVEMLAFSQNANYVNDVLDRIQASSWVPSPCAYVRGQNVNEQAVSMLLARLETIFSLGFTRDSCRRHLQSLIVVDETDTTDTQVQSNHDATLTESRTNRPSTPWMSNRLHSRELAMTMSKQLYAFVRIHIVQPLFCSDNCWENRRRVALCALLLYLAWKRRRRVVSLTASASTLVTAPFREILQALLPQSR